MKKPRIDSIFETYGTFWDHNHPEKTFSGSISSHKGTVELRGSPEYTEGDSEAMRTAFSEANSLPDIHNNVSILGLTAMNRLNRCTLLRPVRLTGDGIANFSTMQTLDRVRYMAQGVVMGLHLESSEANVLDSAAVYLTKIHQFFPRPWRTKQFKEGTERISIRPLKIFTCRNEGLGAKLVCSVVIEGGIKRGYIRKTEIKYKPISRIIITPDKPQSMDWFMSLAFRLENFFSLILGTSAEIKRVQLFQGKSDGWVLQEVRRQKEKIDRQMWAYCKHEHIVRALEHWLSVPKNDQLVELALLGVLRKSNLFPETEFLTLAQALEGFGRIYFGGKNRRKAKFDDLIRKIYGLYTHDTAQKLVGEQEAFIKTIIQTRDYYTHLGNPKGTSAAKKTKEIFLLNKKVYAFLRGAMLIKLGIPEEDFSQAVVRQATMWI